MDYHPYILPTTCTPQSPPCHINHIHIQLLSSMPHQPYSHPIIVSDSRRHQTPHWNFSLAVTFSLQLNTPFSTPKLSCSSACATADSHTAIPPATFTLQYHQPHSQTINYQYFNVSLSTCPSVCHGYPSVMDVTSTNNNT